MYLYFNSVLKKKVLTTNERSKIIIDNKKERKIWREVTYHNSITIMYKLCDNDQSDQNRSDDRTKISKYVTRQKIKDNR